MAFELYRGIDWTRRLTVTDEDTGAVINLTGKTIAVTLKRRSSEEALVTLAVGSGVTLREQSGATEGQADITIAGAASSALTAGNHVLAVTVDGQVVIAPVKLPVRDF